MATTDWSHVEGMIIAAELDPHEVGADLAQRGVLAQLEWFERSPQLLSLIVASDGASVAVVPAGTTAPQAGPTLTELAEALAEKFEAEVRLGGAVVDHLPEGASPLGRDHEDEPAPLSSRVVEIGHTPASSVPLLAALEGVDLADMELPEGARALLAELPPERTGWNFGELPLVTLSTQGDGFQLLLVTDEHLEHVVSHDWGMHQLLVPGGAQSVDDLPTEVVDLVGDRKDLEAIAAQVPGADAQTLERAARVRGPLAVRDVVKALGLPTGVAEFLLGHIDLEAVPGAETHLAKGISNAIGRSVDIMLTEPQSAGSSIWDAYQSAAVERPWLVRTAASVEAAVGAGLLARVFWGTRTNSAWTKVGGALGVFMLVDSLAEVSLVKHLGLRAARRALSDKKA